MSFINTIIVGIHVTSGFASLILFWIPAFTRKGGLSHRKLGIVYVWFMWIVVITAALLSFVNIYDGEIDAAIFLGYLSLITANPLWFGVAILKAKKGMSPVLKTRQRIFNIAIFIGGIGLLAYGIIRPSGAAILMIIFGIIGVFTSFQIIRDLRTGRLERSWFLEHYQGLIISGIAAYTAFFAFGGRQFFGSFLSGYWQVVPWVLPTILGSVAVTLLGKHYTKNGMIRNP